MKQVTINIPDSKYKFFIELVKSLDFTKVEEQPSVKKLNSKQKSFVGDVKQSLKEVELHQQGKIKLQSARDFINDL